MSACAVPSRHNAGIGFDAVAEQYDEIFTRSSIGRAQRNAVWEVLSTTFHAGQRVLELNCGTGEDALFLTSMGVSVYACDASEGMIAVASRRIASEAPGARVQVEVCPTEQIERLRGEGPFDGVLSNFSGLNCVDDLPKIARSLAALVRPGGRIVLCLSTRFCMWETVWYLAHGKSSRAVRRWKGSTTATLGEFSIRVLYPTMRQVVRMFSPGFILRACKGIGVTVPPSYVEHVARKYPRCLRGLERIDAAIASWPVFRTAGDHMLLVLERSTL